MDKENEEVVTEEVTTEDNAGETAADKVEEQTAQVDAAVNKAAKGEITMSELADAINALPERIADVFKEMNPAPRKDTPVTPKPKSTTPVKTVKVDAPGKATFAQRWFG